MFEAALGYVVAVPGAMRGREQPASHLHFLAEQWTQYSCPGGSGSGEHHTAPVPDTANKSYGKGKYGSGPEPDGAMMVRSSSRVDIEITQILSCA